MSKAAIVLLLCAAGVPLIANAEDVDSDTQWALGYTIAEHDCKRPKVRKTGYSTGGLRDRFQRQMKRYQNCMRPYLEGLVADHGKILKIAKAQTETTNVEALASTLKTIQETVETLGPTMDMTHDIAVLETQSRMSVRGASISDSH